MSEFGISDIQRAAERLSGRIVKTPLLDSPMLDAAVGGKILAKAECLQKTGAFKLRGALNKILSMDEEARRLGVVTFSAGNHGQGVAAAARLVGCPAVIVLPKNAPVIKIESCRWWGAQTALYDPETEDREKVAQRFMNERGMALVHPFDDYQVMAGQGTVGLELSEQMAQRGLRPDAVVINCSGGGLSSGVATAVNHAFPEADLYIVEPAGFDKMRRSLASGHAEKNAAVPKTVMDAISGPQAGVRPLSVLRTLAVKCLSVSDDEALHAMALAFRTLKLVIEPGGAASLAAVLQQSEAFRGKTVVVVCSGGNVDPSVFIRALSLHEQRPAQA